MSAIVRFLDAIGLTTVRAVLGAWAISAVLLLAGVALVLAGSTTVGLVLFVLGAAVSVLSAIAARRLRPGQRGERP